MLQLVVPHKLHAAAADRLLHVGRPEDDGQRPVREEEEDQPVATNHASRAALRSANCACTIVKAAEPMKSSPQTMKIITSRAIIHSSHMQPHAAASSSTSIA